MFVPRPEDNPERPWSLISVVSLWGSVKMGASQHKAYRKIMNGIHKIRKRVEMRMRLLKLYRGPARLVIVFSGVLPTALTLTSPPPGPNAPLVKQILWVERTSTLEHRLVLPGGRYLIDKATVGELASARLSIPLPLHPTPF